MLKTPRNYCALALLSTHALCGAWACGSDASSSEPSAGSSPDASITSATTRDGSTAAQGASDAGRLRDAATGGSTAASPTSATDAGSRTSDAATGTGDMGTTSSSTPSDYTFCNYGNVPSGTPPPAWSASPALTPTGENPYGKPATTVPLGYILFNAGSNVPASVPTSLQMSTLQRINDDLKYITEYTYVHLPPWTAAPESHYIDWIMAATGLPKDPGSAGDSAWEGKYPDVETTAIAVTDEGQRYDLTHEFFHVLQNSYGTVPGEQVSWVQESFNDYLIMRLAEHELGGTPGQATQAKLPSNVGYLDQLTYTQPYAPIESCGINKSGEVTGPQDYFNDSTGFRYNDLFPLFVEQRVGLHFFAAVWEQATPKEQILQTMTRLLDKPRVQCMVQEYAARLALGDFVELSSEIQNRADAKMYAATKTDSGWLVPSDATKLPRYTGRNTIPLTVTSGATEVSVQFMPDAKGSKQTPADMRAQLVYRAQDGSAVFSTPVPTGETKVTLTKPPKNGVVLVVISNVTLDGYKTAQSYGWDPTETFGYKLQVTGGTAAPTNKKYF